MIAAAMQEEALQRANSPEGMERLVHALLFPPTVSAIWKQEDLKALATDLFTRIRFYVRLKRIRAIHRSDKPRRTPFNEYYVGAEEVHAARESYRQVQGHLMYRVGWDEVQKLKKEWGRSLTLRRILFEEKNRIPLNLRDFCGLPATEEGIHFFYGNTETDSPQ